MKTKKDVFFAAATVVFAVVAVAFTFWGKFNLGATLSCVLFFSLATCYLADRTYRPQFFPCLCGFLALLSSAVYVLSTDLVFRLLGIFLIPALLAIYLAGLGNSARYWPGGYKIFLDILRTIFVLPFAHLPTTMKNLFSRKPGQSSGKLGKILLGICAALPVLMIIIPLLIRADAAFSDLMSCLVRNFSETFAQILLGTLLAPFIITIFYALKKGLDKPNPAPEACIKPLPKVNATGVTGFLGATSFCYLTYLFSQTAYFFNGFAGILPNGWNVVDYAKRGFFEMCAIAAINLAVIFVSSVTVRRSDPRLLPFPVKLLNLFICLFTLLLIATAQAKMFMYIRDFGATRLRLLTSLFMWLLIVIYLTVILRLFVRHFPYMKVIVVAATLLFISAWGLTPVRKDLNSIVCEYNISAYFSARQEGKRSALDIEYLSTLGSSATPYLAELADNNALPEEIRQEAYTALQQRAENLFDETQTDFKKYNNAKKNEQKFLKELLDEVSAK